MAYVSRKIKCPECGAEPGPDSEAWNDGGGRGEVHCECGEVYSFHKHVLVTYHMSIIS